MFSGESSDPQTLARRINDRFAELKKTLITEEDFEIVRKKQYGKTVRAFSDIDTLANGLIISHFENEDLFAEFKAIKEMKLSFVNEMLQKSFDESKAVLSVVCQQK
jgi:predicted Zn-dependent peptidase